MNSRDFVVVALQSYLKALENQARNVAIMKSKEFDYGTPVIDSVCGDICIVVGHYDIDELDDYGRDAYRVYVSERMSYMGIDRRRIQRYDGEIPENLKHVKWNQVYQVVVPLIETEDLKSESLG